MGLAEPEGIRGRRFARFPFVGDPGFETFGSLEKPTRFRALHIEPQDLIVGRDGIDPSVSDYVAVTFNDDILTEEGLPFLLPMKCHSQLTS
ncbi:hypothetical protein [Arthrobacter sp. H-02-3]|uniref:hypothetical protein n=1 Tax=Arthrobacter sp. H-02-3 TaxID=2703675 RepID=UPI00137B5ECB|nr:hypothetical protein [Arthrobacter sp. H-02-3]